MKKKIIIALNFSVGILSYASWLYMAVKSGNGDLLAGSGFTSLKYFTVLSNLLNGAVSLVYSIRLMRGKDIDLAAKTWKLVGTAAVSLTFLTVMCFLGPVFGYNIMFNGANLFMHLILPLASILSFVFLERDIKIPFKKTLWVMAPVVLYEVGYISNCLINGIGPVDNWDARNDFYGFLLWGWPAGLGIAAFIILATWGFSLLLRKVGKAS